MEKEIKFCPYDGKPLVQMKCEACGSSIDMQQKKRWQRILYERQAFPDDYIDKSFMSKVKAYNP